MARKPAHEQFDTVREISVKAFELFGRYGYEGVSIGDIAKAARLSKGALYWHFDSKEALFLRCLEQLHAIFDEHVFEPMRLAANPLLAIAQMFSGLQSMLQDSRLDQGVGGYWLIPSKPETEALLQAKKNFEARSIETLSGTMRRANDSGEFAIGEDAEQMARAVIALIEACVLPMRQYSPEEMQAMLRVLARTLFRAYARSDELIELADLL